MLGFMSEEESAEVAERHAADVARRRRLRKMVRHRKQNKGGFVRADSREDTSFLRCFLGR